MTKSSNSAMPSSGSWNPPKKPQRDAKWLAMMKRRQFFKNMGKIVKEKTTSKQNNFFSSRKSESFNKANIAPPCTCDSCDMNDSHGSWWVRLRFLGKGGYGAVFFAKRKIISDTNPISTQLDLHLPRKMAVKSAEISRASSLMYERDILGGLACPFVVSCYGDEITKTGKGKTLYNLMLEYCSGSSLLDRFKKYPGGLPECEARVFAGDILKGLNYIHCRGVIHCDIKPENILLVPQVTWLRKDGYVAKIADFGLAMEKDSLDYSEGGHLRGTTCYMAPELVKNRVLDYGVDVWAFGCTVLEMLTGVAAWGTEAGKGGSHVMNMIGYSELVPEVPEWVSKEGGDFLSKCVVRDATQRWSTDALLRHPFLDIEPM